MNRLIVGTKTEEILHHLPDTYLLIDDGELLDQVILPKRRKVHVLDVREDSFNPLKDMSYTKAQDFVSVLCAIFPEGENTLTKATFKYQLLDALLNKPKSLETLIPDTKETQYTYQKIQTLLLSPVLKNVLLNRTTLSFKGIILARLNRAELGDFDCFVLASLLISQYPGPVVIPDFGFYAHAGHSNLIRQNRLVAGISSFDQVPFLRSQLLLIDEKIASHCTADDAKLLALYRGLQPDPSREDSPYNKFITKAIGG